MLDAIRNSGGVNLNGARRGGAARQAELNPDRVVVAKEKHDDGRDHYHVAVRFPQKVRWQSICGYLRYQKRLPSHFSLSHTSWWSALRYPKKCIFFVSTSCLVFQESVVGISETKFPQFPPPSL